MRGCRMKALFPLWIGFLAVAWASIARAAPTSAEREPAVELVGKRAGSDRADELVFDAKVAPILARRCLDCHAGADPKGKLDLSTRRAAFAGGKGGAPIVPGKPKESLLWERIEADEMPPKARLSVAEKAALREWIEAGAGWGSDPIDAFQVTTERRAGRDWWSLQPIRRPTPPAIADDRGPISPIDAFVNESLKANGLSSAPEADRRVLIRRLSFDLLGLPPTPAEVDAFVADAAPAAYERLVDRYLDSPQFGVRWARWWLDLARYGESNGFEFDEFRPNAWRYRDWVVDAFNRDLPYDEFARLQIAGDILSPTDPGGVEATGFLAAGAFDSVGQNQISGAMKAVVRGDEIEDLVGTIGQTFLGLTVNCARCHDHKFDPVRQVEYYRIAAALDGVRQGERDLSDRDPAAIAIKRRIAGLNERIVEIDETARRRIVADRTNAVNDDRSVRGSIADDREGLVATAPEPIAAWDFDRSLDDRRGKLTASVRDGAMRTPAGLRFDGKSAYAETPPIDRDLSAVTLEAWVRLDDLSGRGGGVIGLQSLDGSVFDSIVFGERDPAEWFPGSEGFRRSRGVAGGKETEASLRPIHVAITHARDGTIRVFRAGLPYGSAYKTTPPVSYRAGLARLVFGVRHTPAGGNKMLAGEVLRARLYDRALAPAEIAASASTFGDYIDPKTLTAALGVEARLERARAAAEIGALGESLKDHIRLAHAVVPRAAGITRMNIRGNANQLGDVVAPGGVASLAGFSADFGLPPDAPEAERRKRLAIALTDTRNPLFSRVIVNRLWQAHFGIGLVENSSDLGFNGGRPTHPELLDWLASEASARGWRLKSLHRLIVTSAAYRRSSRSDPVAIRRDSGDRLLWRKSPTRLEAEMVRDAMLSVAGELDTRLGGPSFLDHRIVQAPGTTAFFYVPLDPTTLGQNRRTLYRAWARGGRSSFLDAFDCPDPSTTAPRRAVTTTPLQTLALLNDALVLHLADALADRLKSEAGADPKRQVVLAYRLALSRAPDPEELEPAARVVAEFGAATLARAIFNSNEFLYVD